MKFYFYFSSKQSKPHFDYPDLKLSVRINATLSENCDELEKIASTLEALLVSSCCLCQINTDLLKEIRLSKKSFAGRWRNLMLHCGKLQSRRSVQKVYLTFKLMPSIRETYFKKRIKQTIGLTTGTNWLKFLTLISIEKNHIENSKEV